MLKINKKSLFVLIFLLFCSKNANAGSSIKKAGDWLMLILPAFSLGLAVADSPKSTLEFVNHFLFSNLTVSISQRVLNLKRPDDSIFSFPSGHTVAAFSGASYIRVKYGFKYAIAPYLLAGFVGYSRMDAGRHFFRDIIGSIIVSELTAMWLVKAKVNTDARQLNFIVNPSRQEFGFNFNYKF